MLFRNLVSFLIATILISTTSLSAADFPWKRIANRSQRKSASDPLQLTQKQGPWMIYAASFAGAGAEDEARTLAIELRKRYKLKAYLHSQTYDFTKPVEGIGVNRDLTPKKMRYNTQGRFSEIAVLVGDYDSIDDPDLQATLKKLKYARPRCLSEEDSKTTLRFAGLRAIQKRINGDKAKQTKGPLGRAFAAPNPLVPREVYAPKGVDTFVFKINQGVKYSLLDCPADYSVQVATFRGTVITNQQQVQEIEQGGKLKSRLEEAAIKANKLTTLLRERGIEAYEFHDRHESYVTVGHFDWVSKNRPDGKKEINPAILKVIRQFGATNSSNGMRTTTAQPKKLAGISFDVQPIPVKVPKRSLANDYSSKRWFR